MIVRLNTFSYLVFLIRNALQFNLSMIEVIFCFCFHKTEPVKNCKRKFEKQFEKKPAKIRKTVCASFENFELRMRMMRNSRNSFKQRKKNRR